MRLNLNVSFQMLELSIEITVGSSVGDKLLRSPGSLRWPIDMGWRSSLSVVVVR